MDNVNNIGNINNMQPVRRMKAAYRMSDVAAPSDSVEFSSDVMRLRGVEGGIRMDRVMAVKSQIAAGNYFTSDKLDIAMDRALDQAIGQLFGG